LHLQSLLNGLKNICLKIPCVSGLKFFKTEAISKPAKTVILMKVSIRNVLKLPNSGFRRNDEDRLLQLAQLYIKIRKSST